MTSWIISYQAVAMVDGDELEAEDVVDLIHVHPAKWIALQRKNTLRLLLADDPEDFFMVTKVYSVIRVEDDDEAYVEDCFKTVMIGDTEC